MLQNRAVLLTACSLAVLIAAIGLSRWWRRVPLKVVVFNLFEGGSNLKHLGEFFQKEAADVVGLNEMNGWNHDTFATQARAWGYNHSTFLAAPTGYHLGMMSKQPMELLHNKTGAPLHHGLLLARVQGVVFCVTHLSPRSSVARKVEVDAAVEIFSEYMQTEPFVLMGDLNTLAPSDSRFYDEPAVLEQLKSSPALLRKFVHEGAVDYRPMVALLGAGLVDLAALSGVSVADALDYSVPTPANTDHMHACKLRLDYFMGNDLFVQMWGGGTVASNAAVTVRIQRDEHTGTLSDHFPAICECKSGTWA
jgi:endonuclease/exonuclease/phosphatase family metal-dependent hydrolase